MSATLLHRSRVYAIGLYKACAMVQPFAHLLAPFTLAHVTLRNRLIMGSMHYGYQPRRTHCGETDVTGDVGDAHRAARARCGSCDS